MARFMPDGRHAIVVRNPPGLLEVDLSTGALVRTVKVEASAVSFVRNATVIASPRWEGDVWVADDPFSD